MSRKRSESPLRPDRAASRAAAIRLRASQSHSRSRCATRARRRCLRRTALLRSTPPCVDPRCANRSRYQRSCSRRGRARARALLRRCGAGLPSPSCPDSGPFLPRTSRADPRRCAGARSPRPLGVRRSRSCRRQRRARSPRNAALRRSTVAMPSSRHSSDPSHGRAWGQAGNRAPARPGSRA